MVKKLTRKDKKDKKDKKDTKNKKDNKDTKDTKDKKRKNSTRKYTRLIKKIRGGTFMEQNLCNTKELIYTKVKTQLRDVGKTIAELLEKNEEGIPIKPTDKKSKAYRDYYGSIENDSVEAGLMEKTNALNIIFKEKKLDFQVCLVQEVIKSQKFKDENSGVIVTDEKIKDAIEIVEQNNPPFSKKKVIIELKYNYPAPEVAAPETAGQSASTEEEDIETQQYRSLFNKNKQTTCPDDCRINSLEKCDSKQIDSTGGWEELTSRDPQITIYYNKCLDTFQDTKPAQLGDPVQISADVAKFQEEELIEDIKRNYSKFKSIVVTPKQTYLFNRDKFMEFKILTNSNTINGDGNCLFSSIGVIVNKRADDVRVAIVAKLTLLIDKEEKGEVTEFSDYDKSTDTYTPNKFITKIMTNKKLKRYGSTIHVDTPQDYIKNMGKDGTWGEDLEIQVASLTNFGTIDKQLYKNFYVIDIEKNFIIGYISNYPNKNEDRISNFGILRFNSSISSGIDGNHYNNEIISNYTEKRVDFIKWENIKND